MTRRSAAGKIAGYPNEQIALPVQASLNSRWNPEGSFLESPMPGDFPSVSEESEIFPCEMWIRMLFTPGYFFTRPIAPFMSILGKPPPLYHEYCVTQFRCGGTDSGGDRPPPAEEKGEPPLTSRSVFGESAIFSRAEERPQKASPRDLMPASILPVSEIPRRL